MNDCDVCRFAVEVSNSVPYGNGYVNEQLMECTKGYNRGDCDEEFVADDDARLRWRPIATPLDY